MDESPNQLDEGIGNEQRTKYLGLTGFGEWNHYSEKQVLL